MDATLCRQHVEKLLTEESASLDRLTELLESEFSFLNGNDVDALERATDARQACMSDLLRLEEERRSLCRMCGHRDDLAGLEALLKWCDPQHTLKSHWNECAIRTTNCRALNDRNGLIVTSRLKRVEGLLNIITGRNQAPSTYGRHAAYAPTNAGRMISSQA